MLKLKIINSKTFNPYENLAMEEYLLNNVSKDEIILYLWQNNNTIVIGQNQNPWLQCNVEYSNENDILIARRLSGGGTVFHDLGNLNYTIITTNNNFNIDKNFKLIINAIKKLGVNPERSGRNDIIVGNKKISGVAFYSDSNNSYQHGCILVNTDLDRMFQCLNVKEDKIVGKGIDSVRSRVMNLCELESNISPESLSVIIQNEFRTFYDDEIVSIEIDKESMTEYNKLFKKYSSWEWNMGRQMKSQMSMYKRFPWGDCNIILDNHNGYISDVGIYSDSLETEVFHKIEKALKGVKFLKKDICNSICIKNDQTSISKDIADWIYTECKI